VIHSSSSKGHRFVLVAIDYFTKWTKVVALKNMTHMKVIEFITDHIIHRFYIPQTLTIDQGASFMSKEVWEFAKSYRIKLSIHLHIMLRPMYKPSLVIGHCLAW
jgi:hypothetical protein